MAVLLISGNLLPGGDGTVYVAGYDGLGALRDGKLIWAFHGQDPRVTMADDGRIWFPAPGSIGHALA